MNVSATLSAFKLLIKPSLCIPHATVSTFDRVPNPVSEALAEANGGQKPDIRAVALDKDNCFALPRENSVHKPYANQFKALREAYPGRRLLIVSNSSGTRQDHGGMEAKLLEDGTAVEVFRHSTKKPGCGYEVFEHLRSAKEVGVTHPSQIAVIGDRLFTDVMMANMIGAWAIWVKDGVTKEHGPFARLEKAMPAFLDRYGCKARKPPGPL